MKYFAKIKYVGTHFFGFQVQPDRRTVQGVLNEALALAFGAPCRITGCSRTDAGVHANELAITIETDGNRIPPERLPLAVTRFLPCDLSLFYAKYADEDFHVRHDVAYKEYLYRIKNSPVPEPFEVGRSWFLPKKITEEKIERMRAAAERIVGKHDFSAFMAEGSDATDTTRNVMSLKIDKIDDVVEIRITADGFLYNMVRIIVGTLVEVAYGRFTADDVERIIAERRRASAGMTAPPDGLYLNRVVY